MKVKESKRQGKAVKAEQPDLIETPPVRWTVTSLVVEREWKNNCPVKVRVSKLRFNGRAVHVLEGPTGERSLQALADDLNARGADARFMKKCLADIQSESARAAFMLRHQSAFTGPGFAEPAENETAGPG